MGSGIDNGMPVVVVVVPAAALGRTGYESVAELEADAGLGEQVRATPGSGPRTCSATRTGTRWSCTGKPSGTRRRMS